MTTAHDQTKTHGTVGQDGPDELGFYVVHHSVPRADALAKVTGQARYTADFHLPQMAHAKVLRSPFAHARIVSVDVSAASFSGRSFAVESVIIAPSLMVRGDAVIGDVSPSSYVEEGLGGPDRERDRALISP